MNLRQIRILISKDIRCFLRDWHCPVMLGLPLLFIPLVVLFMSQVVSSEKATVATATSVPQRIRVAFLGIEKGSPIRKRTLASADFEAARSASPLEDLKNQRVDLVIELSADPAETTGGVKHLRLKVHYDGTRAYSTTVWDRVNAVLWSANYDLARERLGNPALSEASLQPLSWEYKDRAAGKGQSEILIRIRTGVFAFLLVVGVLVAFSLNFAILVDDREGGTVETILSAPIERVDMLAAKAGMLLLVATVQMFIYGLASGATLALVPGQLRQLMGGSLAPGDVPLVFFCLLLMALFSCALLSVLCAVVQSYKAAYNLVGCVLAAQIFLCIPPFLPGYSLHGIAPWVPMLNVTAVINELFMGVANPAHFAAMMLSMLFHSAACFFVAYKLAATEAMLFGGVGSLRLALKPSNIRPQVLPTQSEVMLFSAGALMLLLYLGLPIQVRDLGVGLMLTEALIFLVAPWAFARYRKCDLGKTFRLILPPARSLLPCFLILVGTEMALFGVLLIHDKLLPFPPELVKAMEEGMRSIYREHSLVGGLILIAILPGLCEEFTFRGLVLSGFLNGNKPWTAIIGSALLFALFHLNAYRIIPTFMIGLAAGFAVWSTGSIFVGMLFHALHNGVFSYLVVYQTAPGSSPAGLADFSEVVLPLAALGVSLIWLGGTLESWRRLGSRDPPGNLG